jgi:hypothetical protein
MGMRVSPWLVGGAFAGVFQAVFTIFIQRDISDVVQHMTLEQKLEWFFPHNAWFVFAGIGFLFGFQFARIINKNSD